jgi:hypothetical protein
MVEDESGDTVLWSVPAFVIGERETVKEKHLYSFFPEAGIACRMCHSSSMRKIHSTSP